MKEIVGGQVGGEQYVYRYGNNCEIIQLFYYSI